MKGVIMALVAIHLAVTLWHGGAHGRLAVTLPPAKNAFVLVVIVAAPVVAAVLLWLRRVRAGVWVFFSSMLGAFLFGAYHHYVLVSSDHIHHLPDGDASTRSAFVASAGALALLELASALYGAFCLGKLRESR